MVAGQPRAHGNSGAPPAERELVPLDSASGLRWFRHDYPHPLARWHHHPEIEIHLITASSGTAHIGSAVRVFEPGSLFLLGSGLPHNWVSSLPDGETVPGRDVLLQADPRLMARLIDDAQDLKALGRLLDDAAYGIEFTGRTRDAAAQALQSMRGSTGITRFVQALSLLSTLATAPPEDWEMVDPHYSAEALPREESLVFDQALQHIYQHLSETIFLEDLAELLGMSRSSISRLFTRATSVGFSRTVNRLRVSEACRLLRMSNQPVSEICWQVGFSNLSNFNRRFREETGTTPRAYRRSVAKPMGNKQPANAKSP